MKEAASNAASFVAGCYLLVCGLTVPYFNWQYAKEHGFWQWIFFGEVIATFKAVLWPYFLFF